MKQIIEKLQKSIAQDHPDFGDGKSVLTMLYEAYSECSRMDDDQIKADFNERYRLMNGIELREMDRIIYPVCTFCRDYEKAGFVNGVMVEVLLSQAPNENGAQIVLTWAPFYLLNLIANTRPAIRTSAVIPSSTHCVPL